MSVPKIFKESLSGRVLFRVRWNLCSAGSLCWLCNLSSYIQFKEIENYCPYLIKCLCFFKIVTSHKLDDVKIIIFVLYKYVVIIF